MVHIICFGNLWAGDDGVGIHVFNELNRQRLDDGVRIFDAGLSGFGALNCFEHCDKAIVIDAVQGPAPAGSVHRFTLTDFPEHVPVYSSHDMGIEFLPHYLPIAFADRPLPQIVLFAVAIDPVDRISDALSPAVKNAIPEILHLVSREWITHPGTT